MFSALKLTTAGIVLALIGGSLLAGGFLAPEQAVIPAAPTEDASPSADAAPTFPTGTFPSSETTSIKHLEFFEDGSGRYFEYPGTFEVWFRYGVNGDLWTEMAHDSSLAQDRQVPATYYWDWDGELLSFELWGEELNPATRGATMDHEYRRLPGSRVVVVASSDIPAGEAIYSTSIEVGIVPTAEAGREALTAMSNVIGRISAVPIDAGQAITPDLLEPAE